MGEFSKLIGEKGEDIVSEFLALIGWKQLKQNFDIESIDHEKHGKKTHGIDAFFSYESPMISRTQENILISVKYSINKYPNAPVEKFKDHYKDLAMAIESFKKSELRNSFTNRQSNIETTFDRGVIFWLNNVDDDTQNLLSKLNRIELPKDFNHDGIFLVDNNKIDFFYHAISFVKGKHSDKQVQFTYFNTGLNGDNDRLPNGTIMPIQYLASNIIPFRIETKENGTTLVLCSKENFEEIELIKLIGLAKNMTMSFQKNTIIAFPDYNALNHGQLVENVKVSYSDKKFSESLTVENFYPNFRN